MVKKKDPSETEEKVLGTGAEGDPQNPSVRPQVEPVLVDEDAK